ncbi:MAG: D-alanyl-D-alanine carboxypeptidase, partial [Fibrobacter sp.]|nr:D-alanyl-D-alanine carboxypeptidase [Fibrobacter sp.]
AMYNFVSEPISKFVDNMFKYSSNFAAEMLFKTIAAQDSVPGSWASGAKRVTSWWESCKLPGKLEIANGAGMGNVNKLSAVQIVGLLSHVWNEKSYMPEYLSSLSVSGIDGTLKARFKKSPLKGVVRGKTGTLNSVKVSNLAGYLLLGKRNYAFAIICNGVGKGQYDNWVTQEKILEKFSSEINK